MLHLPGFRLESIATQLGSMVYYRSDADAKELNGGDRPPLVFLHGFGGGSSAYEWSNVFPAFAADYRVFAPDLIGWGESDHPAKDYQIEDYLTVIQDFFERLSLRSAYVVASSLTAAFVIRVAIAHPDLFKALILVSPSGIADFGNDYKSNFFAQLVSIPLVDRVLYHTAIATRSGIQNFLEQRQFARSSRIYPEIVDAYLASAKQENAEYSALSFVRGDLCFDLALFIPELKTPTALIWGSQSQLTPVDIGQRFAKLNPSAVQFFEVLDDVGLTPQLEVPAVTIGLIRKFLLHLEQG